MTDSACDLPDEVVRAHGIRIVPLELISDDRTYRDRVDITAEEFAESMQTSKAHLTTSQPSPGAFVEGFRDAAEDAESLLVVTLGSALSGTFGSAEAAARMVGDVAIRVVDSRALTLLQGLLVVKAAELAESAMTTEAIAAELDRVRNQSGVFVTVDRYDRLLASGRVGKGVALVGSSFAVKPILSVEVDGRVVRRAQALGRKRVLPAVMNLLDRAIPKDVEKVRFGIVHVGVPAGIGRCIASDRGALGRGRDPREPSHSRDRKSRRNRGLGRRLHGGGLAGREQIRISGWSGVASPCGKAARQPPHPITTAIETT